MIDYKEQGRLMKRSTLERLEQVQLNYAKDTMFSKSISIVDFIKVVNMAYYGNDPDKYELIANRDRKRLKKYLDNFEVSNVNGGALSVKELLDTAHTTLRVRCQMKDIGSYEVADKVDLIKSQIDSIMNPDRPQLERLYALVEKGRSGYIDSLVYGYSGVYNTLTDDLAKGNSDLQFKFQSDPELIKAYYKKPGFKKKLRAAIDQEYFDITLTGTSVVASEGTRYLVNNLFSSLLFAIVSISILMAILFRSWRMVIVAMVPNLVPLIVTGGIMGWLGIPLKPSTLLVFSIALGISVDDTIHYLAKYRQELKLKTWTLKECVLIAIRESGLGMFYTSIVLFCGFSVFLFSQFGGTQALGLLISVTLLIAMITNLLILPSLLLSLERSLTTKAFEEPYFDAYTEESEVDWSDLQLSTDEDLGPHNQLPNDVKPDTDDTAEK
jgi:predicted RND superfamily exporter protein